MTIQTRVITVTLFDNDGDPLPNAKVQITLRGLGNEPGGAVSPGTQIQMTNTSGIATFELWQNNSSYSNTYYEISSWNPVTGVPIHRREKFTVPDHDADVKDLLAMDLAGVDPNQQLLDEIRSAMSVAVDASVVSTQQAVVSSGQASISAAQAVIATTQANTATLAAESIGSALQDAQAAVSQAQDFANSASSSSATAGVHAANSAASSSESTSQASISTAQAVIATTQAGIATARANEAGDHKDSAFSSAGIATAQAVIATTQADISTNAAATSTTQAGIATAKANEADASKLVAEAAGALAQKWAIEAEDVPVTVGLYSAYHWAKKAESLVVGATEGAIVSINGLTGPSVTLSYSHVGAASAAQGSLAASAIQPSDLSAALSDYVEIASLSATLSDYVTVLGLATSLGDYYTKTSADARYLQLGAIEASTHIKRIRTLAMAAL